MTWRRAVPQVTVRSAPQLTLDQAIKPVEYLLQTLAKPLQLALQ